MILYNRAMGERDNKLYVSSKNIYLPGYITKEQTNDLCCLQSCGVFVCEKDYLTDRKDYSYYLFYYVISGKSYLKYNDESYILRKGDAFLIDCSRHQVYGADKDDPCTITYAHFFGGCSKYFYDKIVEEKGYVFSMYDAEIIYISIKEIIKHTKYSSKYKIEKIANIIYRLLNDLLISNIKEDSPYDTAAGFARKCVLNNSKITVEDMSNMVGYSKFHFTKRFSRHFGVSPYEFIIKERIELCKSKLINTNAAISSIAFECGFTDTSHLTNCFKKHEGITPSKFRKTNRV